MHSGKILSVKSVKKMKRIKYIAVFILIMFLSGCTFTIGTKYHNKNTASYGSYYIVKKGDDLYRISLYYGVSVQDIESANNMSSSNIEPGERLFIPGVRKKQPSYSLVPPGIQQNYSEQEPTTSTTILKQNVPERTSVLFDIKKKQFVWPVRGKIIGRYGEFDNHGIDIEAHNGTSVVAAIGGVVEYIGWTEKYGPTIVIANNDRIYTVYGHNITIEVKQGQKVTKNQIIAKINSKQAEGYLHFEIRENITPINPLDCLPSYK